MDQSTLTSTALSHSLFSRLFKGRLNRIDYIRGYLFLVMMNVLFIILGFVLYYLPNILLSYLPSSAFLNGFSIVPVLLLALGVLSIIFVYSTSFVLRRLHDFNQGIWLYILVISPSVILLLCEWGLGFYLIITGLTSDQAVVVVKSSSVFHIVQILSQTIGLTFGLCLLFWPGTKGNNKYGSQQTKNSFKEILALSKKS